MLTQFQLTMKGARVFFCSHESQVIYEYKITYYCWLVIRKVDIKVILRVFSKN